MRRVCDIEGCESGHYGLGYCHKHYRRLKEYGHPLNPSYNEIVNTYLNEIVLKHFDTTECLIWPFTRNRDGYAIFHQGYAITCILSRYICEVRHGPPSDPSQYAAHSCDNGPDGCINQMHLDWNTSSKNAYDRWNR